MKHLNAHPIHENDSHLSTATILNNKADKTIVSQERENDNEFQRLSTVSKRNDQPSSTIQQQSRPEQGNTFQKISHVTEIENDTESSVGGTNTRKDSGSYQRLSSATKIDNDTNSTYKVNKSCRHRKELHQ